MLQIRQLGEAEAPNSPNFESVKSLKSQSELLITDLKSAVCNPERVNVFVNKKYCFSLDLTQVVDFKIKLGQRLTSAQLADFRRASEFGKLYARALDYCLRRPHSVKEVRDYLWQKTRITNYKTRSGEIKQRAGVDQQIADQVLQKLQQKAYVDDQKFTVWWVENRDQSKGVSRRKIRNELVAKGISSDLIDSVFAQSSRDDQTELQKMIAKKQARYAGDKLRFTRYLLSQGFNYDDIKSALKLSDE